MDESNVELRHYTGRELNQIRQAFIALYAEVFAHEIDNPFWSVENFARRIDRHATMPGFDAIVAYHGNEPIGYAYGIILPATTRWWATIQPPLTDSEFTREDGHRTFAVFEVIVKPEWQNQGIGRHIHDNLLSGRSEQRVTIATHQGNAQARKTYLRWGYEHIGTRQPTPSAPVLDVFLRSRRLNEPSVSK
jgi:ribosomal protein S18 acetylase RimI-like enzyme